jgi:toxin ParE1/3/4
MAAAKWRVRLGEQAERDFMSILQWTAENFGERQAGAYQNVLTQSMRELVDGPEIAGARLRNDIVRGIYTLHVARHGRRGRHLLLYRVIGDQTIEIARILHDSMDLRRHLPFSPENDKM